MCDDRTLIHVGFIKAGSSFLQAWLDYLPRVHLLHGPLDLYTSAAELINDAIQQPDASCCRVISEERFSGGLACMDGYFRLLLRSRGYHLSPPPLQENIDRVCRRLRQLYPQARILIVTRGFAGILPSVYSEYIRLGGCLNFEGFLHNYAAYIEAWLDYDFLIERYLVTFGEENVLLLPFELLQEDELRFRAEVSAVLGVEDFPQRIGQVHPSFSAKVLHWYAALSRHTVTPIASRLSERKAIRLHKLYALLFLLRDRPLLPIRLVSRVSDRSVDFTLPAGYLAKFRGCATLLDGRPHYEPYRADYLLDQEESRRDS